MKQTAKTKVVIIGSGFAGLGCALNLSRAACGLEVTVIDRKVTFDFLPSLPDVLGRKINPHLLSSSIKAIAEKKGFGFIRQEILSIDLFKKEISAQSSKINYDYLVIASGSETNFYGNDKMKESVYTLDSVSDAIRLESALKASSFDNFIVAGGGYTGVEIAGSLRRFLSRDKKRGKIIIIEKAESILGALPQWMKDYAGKNLLRLNVEVLPKTSIETISGRQVYVSGGKVFDNALVIWAAGVKTAKFIQGINTEKNAQGRLKVDKYLRLNNNCFAIGDAAYVRYGENYLRMAVQFAITQGAVTAINIIASVKGKKLIEYKPVDLGFIIPMANNRSCGTVFGLNLKGRFPTLLHFAMCVYRLYGLGNKIGFVKNLTGNKSGGAK